MHSLSFVIVGAIRVHFRIHLTEITGNFVECIYSINPSIKREALLFTYKVEMEKITVWRRNFKKTRDYGVKVLSYFKGGQPPNPHPTSIPENWTHMQM